MKKILSLLILLPFMAISQTVPADATALENIQITNNTTSLTATKVNVQDANGVINTIPKSDLVNVIEVNDVPSLPLIGEVGKIYVVKNINKIYRWNGTFYQELAVTDISGKINLSEKGVTVATLEGGKIPNSQIPALAISETFPVSSQAQMLALSQADQGDVAIRSDISKSFILRVSPSSVLANWSELLTPTSAVTSVAGKVGVVTLNTSDVGGLQSALDLKANDSDVVKLTGDQTISGQKSFSLTGKIDMQTNDTSPAIMATALGSNGSSAAMFINNSSSPDSSALHLQAGLSGGVGNMALDVWNQSPIGTGIFSKASNGGVSISSQSGDGDSYISNITYGGTGRNYVGRNNGAETFSVDKTGNIIGNSFVKRSSPINNILLAGGGDLSQGTAFNKNFGTTAGTVAEGNDSRLSDSRTPLAGSTNYIQNQNSSAQSADSWISGSSKSSALGLNNGTNVFNNSFWGTIFNISTGNGSFSDFAFLNHDNEYLFYNPIGTKNIIFSGEATFASSVTSQLLKATNLSGTGDGNIVAASDGTLKRGAALGSNAYTSTAYLAGFGTTNYIPKFTGSGTIGNSSIYDNGTNVGIGSQSLLHSRLSLTSVDNVDSPVLGSQGGGISIASGAQNIAINAGVSQTTGNGWIQNHRTNGVAEAFPISLNPLGGNILIGTTTDDGVNKLQVNGSATFSSSVTASSFNGSATLTGIPTAPTAALGTNTTQIATTAFVQSNSRPYKVYTALLSQSGTNAPVATVLENTLGGTVVWSRESSGMYQGYLAGAFVTNKSVCFYQSSYTVAGLYYAYNASVESHSTARLHSIRGADYADDSIAGQIEIRVYN